jgi:exodeoxyribonuclease VII large subunit
MDKVFSVSEFIAAVNAAVAFPVVVEGEVSGFNVSQGRWVFFDLKDEKVESKVNCFMPVYRLKTSLEDGMRVRVYGTPKIHERSGRFSITVDRVELVGEGALKRAFELLFKKLETEGLFAEARKRAIPKFPERIGLIASRESAAYSDFMRILNNRWGGASVSLAHVHVQGVEAVSQITGALKYFSSPSAPSVDVLVLIRGGGSLEDLQAFNSEAVARAIYGSRVPVVVGVGHEPDVSIADYVADVRASTPSNAAERIVPDRREVLSQINYFAGIARGNFEHLLAEQKHRIHASVDAIERVVLAQVARFNRLMDSLAAHLRRTGETLVHYGEKVALVMRSLKNLHPETVLARGYAIVRSGGKVVKDAAILKKGDVVNVRLHKGSAHASINEIASLRSQ